MPNLKKNSAFIALLALMFALPMAAPPPSEAYFTITIYFGKARCEPGFGICRIDIGAAREAEASTSVYKGQATADVERVRTAKDAGHYFLKIEMRNQLPTPVNRVSGPPYKPSVMPVAENLTLDSATSEALGFKSATVLKGEYKIDYSKNKYGSMALNVDIRN